MRAMKLHRFRYSPYARKVQRLLELARIPHEVVDVPYGNREELARITGGYIYVPVLELPDGRAITESRRICEHLLEDPRARGFVPEGQEAAVWAYCDGFVEGPLEDVLFRIVCPAVRDAWPTQWERALYTLVKERRYGAGCIDDWRAQQGALIERGRALLEPTRQSLERHPWVLGETLTLADIALYGQWVMLDCAGPELVDRLGPMFRDHARRVEEAH